jgi:membrane protease YdiL (CAAX protease family)
VFILASVAGVLGLRVVHSFVAHLIPVDLRELAFVLVMTGGLLIGHAWTFHLVDPRGWDFVGLGTSGWHPDRISRSAMTGALAIAVPVGVLLAAGWVAFEPSEDGRTIRAGILALGILVPAALWEELFVRGYAFSAVREAWGPMPAIVVTSLVFGVMHYLNQGASIQAVVVVCLAGVFLGLVRDRTRSLYAAWAAHVAWNAVLVVFLHATISGIAMPSPDYRLVDAGPDWATGGAWGPEGGFFAAAGLTVAIWHTTRRWTRRRDSGDARS